jgi:predicted kinase
MGARHECLVLDCAGVGVSRSLLVVVSGLPASGKSTVAVALAQRIQAVALSRDAAREEIGGPAVESCLDPIAWKPSAGSSGERNPAVGNDGGPQARRGPTRVVEVVADRDTRRRLDALAAKHGAPVYSIEVICSDPAGLARRLRTRRGNWQRVVAEMSKTYEPAAGALVVDSRDAPAEMVNRAVDFVRRETG